ncbi:MAG: alpha,alpha-trehalose-phosphate synthase (UDP-forming) [Acetobacteraceae bacterium]
MSTRRLVVVSNRVPVPTERGPRAGGLAVALADALGSGSLWFGWSGRRTARAGSLPAALVEAGGITYATIDLSEAEYRLFYAGFSNRVLWPLLHFRLGLVHYRSEEYQAYRAVNRRFAEALAPLLQPDDLIWVHDYHLFPLGEELRARGVTNRIGFFLHTPFVPPEVLRALPRAEQILASLCAYDVVGFHTEEFRTGFLRSVHEILGLTPDGGGGVTMGGRRAQAIVDPIGINAEGFATTAEQSSRGSEVRRLRASLAGRALAIGVDRLDYSKGLVQRLDAFGRLLARHPEHRRRVSFLQVAARSREDVSEYQDLRIALDRIVGDTIGQYSEFDWVPVRYMTRPLSRGTLAGFYRVAHIGVVTPLRDGMNLVAKEYIAAQDRDDPGVLILSCFAGAAAELAEALIVNPFDPDEIANAMHTALTMRLEERQARHTALRTRVWNATARRFSEHFLAALGGAGGPA